MQPKRHSSGGGFWAWLWGEDADTATTTRSAYSNEGDVYDRQARAGNTVLSVMLHDNSLIHQAVTILDAHHPLEIDEHTHETEPTSRSSGSFVQPETAGKTSASPSGVDYSTSAVATPATGIRALSSSASRPGERLSPSRHAGIRSRRSCRDLRNRRRGDPTRRGAGRDRQADS